MLKAESITYQISDKILLDNVSVNFDAGKLHLIIGPNGAGKSTLVNVLCGQLRPSHGTVRYGGRDLNTMSSNELAKVRGVLSQNIDLAFPLKVWEVVMMGRYPHFTGKPGAQDEVACREAMSFFDVHDMQDRNYMTLSGGEKQRVHFARVIAQVWYPPEQGCRYLVLDEPLTFLDVKYQFRFMNKLDELLQKNDMVIVGVVHDLNLAAKFAGSLTLINKGRIIATGSREEVLTKENISRVYDLDPVIVEDKERKSYYLFFE